MTGSSDQPSHQALNRRDTSEMNSTEQPTPDALPTLSEVYARYFFSVFDACHNQDEAGRRLATRHLEESLGFGRAEPSSERAGSPL